MSRTLRIGMGISEIELRNWFQFISLVRTSRSESLSWRNETKASKTDLEGMWPEIKDLLLRLIRYPDSSDRIPGLTEIFNGTWHKGNERYSSTVIPISNLENDSSWSVQNRTVLANGKSRAIWNFWGNLGSLWPRRCQVPFSSSQTVEG
jgi:hypothetical protein